MRRSLVRGAVALLPLLALLGGCDMAPSYQRPVSAIPKAWPGATGSDVHADVTAASLGWQNLITDAKLRAVIAQALAHNQDLRAAVANVAAARAEYHVQRSYELPTLSAGADAALVRGLKGAAINSSTYGADIGASSFEIDLFHRLRNLSRAAFETFLSTRSGLAATRITLVAETATAYATLASDRDLLALAQRTAQSGQRSLDLTQSLLTAGLGSAVDVQNAITVVEQANADAANDAALVQQDRNALELLTGAPVPDALLPGTLDELEAGVAAVPAGLSSSLLLNRPDVQEAEHTLKAANADIGAARAAFFPTITLTSTVGLASTALSTMFTGGALNWALVPTASVPLLGGTNPGNLEYAHALRDEDEALYQKALQTAFEEVANALARRAVIDRQLGAEQRLVTASANARDLSDAEYRAGTGDYLDVLTAERTLYSNQQSQIATRLTDITSRLSLYEALAPGDRS